MAIDVDVSDAMKDTTLTVDIRPKRMWLLKLRLVVGCWLIWMAARVLGSQLVFNTIEKPE